MNLAIRSDPVVVGSILIGADDLVKEMVRGRMPWGGDWRDYKALGVILNGRLIGGVVYHDYRQFDINMSAAFEPGWARRGVIRALFAYPFETLNVRRVTSITGRKNKKARKLLEDLGYTLEGVSPKNYDGIQDACIYGLLRENCKWLRHGKINTETPARP